MQSHLGDADDFFLTAEVGHGGSLRVPPNRWDHRGMAKKDTRFEKIHSESLRLGEKVEILRDTHTGVCYLWRASGYGGGLTPLLDAQGKPLIEHARTSL